MYGIDDLHPTGGLAPNTSRTSAVTAWTLVVPVISGDAFGAASRTLHLSPNLSHPPPREAPRSGGEVMFLDGLALTLSPIQSDGSSPACRVLFWKQVYAVLQTPS